MQYGDVVAGEGGPALVASGGGAREHARGAHSAFRRSEGRGHFYAFAVTGRARFGHKMGTGWAQRRFVAPEEVGPVLSAMSFMDPCCCRILLIQNEKSRRKGRLFRGNRRGRGERI